MSAYTIVSDIASVIKPSKDTVLCKPNNQFIGTELNDDRISKLYGLYCGLLLEQYAEQLKEKNDGR